MKPLKNIALILLLPLLTFCTNQTSDKKTDKVYASAELIGKWKQVGMNTSQNDTDPEIKFIELVNDSIAEVQIIDSIGERKISGKWKNQFEKQVKHADIKIESDISITYKLNRHHSHMLLLELDDKNGKLIMSGGVQKFEKE